MKRTSESPTNLPEPSHPHNCEEYAHVPFAYDDVQWDIEDGTLVTEVACMYSDRPHGHYECDATAFVHYEPHDDRNHAPPCPDLCEQMVFENWYIDEGAAPRCEPANGEILDVGQHHVEVRGDCVHCDADVVVYYERAETGTFDV